MRPRAATSPGRHARRHVAALALVTLLSVALAGALVSAPPLTAPPAGSPSPAPAPAPLSAVAPAPAPEEAARALPEAPPRADAQLQRGGRTAFAGGYLALTPDFASADGVYDVVLHFHGNTELVAQSLAYARIGAVFVPQNLGAGSGPYEARFSDPAALPEMLDRIQAAMEKRGLVGARLGRLALIAWSAGYGAVAHILDVEALAERVDAVILLDGMHIGRAPGRGPASRRPPAVAQIAPYERFARWAVAGRKLFTITHSDIAPDAYVGARDTADVLLARLGVLRYAGGEEAQVPDIPAAEAVLSRHLRLPLQPLTLADKGELRVRGYAGDGPEHHVYHLLEMASIALPDLAAWWARSREASP